MSAETVFWACAGLLAYTYLGYPLLAWLAGVCFPRGSRLRPDCPPVSIVIVACNEADCIRQKLDNLLTLDYPHDRLEIIVASDGSTDATAAQARACRDPAVKVVEFATRRGKSAVLNDVLPGARHGIVVLADARQRFGRAALRALAAHFADPAVGAVGGDLVMVDTCVHGSEIGKGVGFYWRYEQFIRRNESRFDSTVGVSGAIYAIRRDLFEPVPQDIILEDVLIPMQIARRGYRVLFEPNARAYDRVSPTAGIEFGRKVRTIAGNFQLFFRRPWLLAPWSNRLWFQTLSHKACRLASPACLLATLLASAALAHRPLFAALFALQVLFYVAVSFGYRHRNSPHRPFILNVPYTFFLLNWATVVGLVRLVTGRQRVTWQKTDMR